MIIERVVANRDLTLDIDFSEGISGKFDIKPYLEFEVFKPLSNYNEFSNIYNGKYYIEWKCGADLSIDSIEAHLVPNIQI